MERLRRVLVRTGLALAVLLLVATGAGVAWLDGRIRAYLAGPPLGATRIYAAPLVLTSGGRVPGGSLVRKLGRLGYRAVAGTAPLAAGEFRWHGDTVDLVAEPSPEPWATGPRRARVVVRDGVVTDLRELEGAPLERFELEPEVLAVLGREGPALGAGEDEAPPICRAAVFAAEDRNFLHHPGVDPIAIARALLADLRAGAPRQGGSTLTQQLVKNTFLSPRRTLVRKLQEAALAILLEVHTTKEEILRRYLASVYLGTDGDVPIHGFAEGAQVYFGKALPELGPAECALLAGLIRSPNGLAPRRYPRAALVRRNRVLAGMAEEGLLDAAASAAATREPLRLAPPRVRSVAALYVAAEVAHLLPELLPPRFAQAPGLSVFTAIDVDLQHDAERAVRHGIDTLEEGRHRRQPLQAALLALDPQSGRVRALVGGRDYGSSPLDRAMRARRQPGSAFKPFVYLVALDPSRRPDAPARTVVSPLEDEPIAIELTGSVWRPANYDGEFAGTLPLEDALAGSRNAATVRLALDVGLEAVQRAAVDAGISSPLPQVPSLALGVAETSLLELTAAYGVFADGGVRRPPALIVAVTAGTGETLYAAPSEETRVLTPGVAYLVTHLLERVIDTGTGKSAREAGLEGPAAGKTGTTDDTRDAWFIGFTSDVVAGVWVGRDDHQPIGLTGAQAALPIWTDFVRSASPGGPAASAFPVPDDIVWRDVDPTTGLLATAGCPETRHEPYLVGSEPRETCDQHGGGLVAVGEEVGEAVRDGGKAIESVGRRVRDWFGRLFH